MDLLQLDEIRKESDATGSDSQGILQRIVLYDIGVIHLNHIIIIIIIIVINHFWAVFIASLFQRQRIIRLDDHRLVVVDFFHITFGSVVSIVIIGTANVCSSGCFSCRKKWGAILNNYINK